MNSIATDERAESRTGESAGYRVEVSGWDTDERFFVEKSMLVWTESAGKTLVLKALVRTGSVLFVRLIQPLGGGGSFPVPYRAVDFKCDNRGSGGVLTLEQLQPRMAFRESAIHLMPVEPQVA
jgi:hypothetical protein